MPHADARGALAATYFDGRSPLPRPVTLRFVRGWLWVEGENVALRVAPAQVQWPERQRHGPRIATLAVGGSLQCDDRPGWDWLAAQAGRAESSVVRVQQNWRAAMLALCALIGVLAAAYVWGIPIAGRAVTTLLPPSVDARLGAAVLRSLDAHAWKPSGLPAPEQERLRQAMQQMLERAGAAEPNGALTLHFRDLGAGPNALALPGGVVVMSDSIVALANGRDDLLIGVFAHEAGHVRHRHGMRMLVQATLVSAASTVLLGDISSMLAAAPALLGQLAYSRDFEREADAECLRLLRANGLDGMVMVEFFERLTTWQQRQGQGDAVGVLSSHPMHAERIQFFRNGR